MWVHKATISVCIGFMKPIKVKTLSKTIMSLVIITIMSIITETLTVWNNESHYLGEIFDQR